MAQVEPMFRIEEISREKLKSLVITGGYVSVYPRNEPKVAINNWQSRTCTLADSFQPILNRVYNFEVREDDVWIITSTKCGTTWTQEMCWLILNDLNYETAKTIDLTFRSPFLEFNGVVPNVSFDTIDTLNNMNSPRLIKSHMPIHLLPKQLWTKNPKIIYVFRNPKDAAISYYHHWRGMVGYKGSKKEFMQSYMDGNVNFNPFWPHVLEFWNLRDQPNVFFTSYERMKQDLKSVINEIGEFLNKPVPTDQMDRLIDHLSFDKMKNNPACNHVKEFESIKQAAGVEVEEFRFVRRGVVGSHKDELPSDVIQEFDNWTKEQLRPHNLTIEDIISYVK